MTLTRLLATCLLLPASLWLSGCMSSPTTGGYANYPSQRPTRYVPHDSPVPGSGSVGIESQDIVAMTDKMARDMLANPALNKRETPATVIVDEEYFVNDSSQRLNKRLIVDRLRGELFRAANGRIHFVARHAEQMVRDEQARRADGRNTGIPTTTLPTADYRLTGRFMNLPGGSQRGDRTNYVQVHFEMVDLNSGALVYSGMHEFKKSSREAMMYQ